ncbi:hypothetical protein Peur_027180 [Populus x canadensis]|jgi:hypothetical protein
MFLEATGVIRWHGPGNVMASFLGLPADHNKTKNDYKIIVGTVEFALQGTYVISTGDAHSEINSNISHSTE